MRGFQWTIHEWEFSLAAFAVGALLTFIIMDFLAGGRLPDHPIIMVPVFCVGIISGKAWYFLSSIG